MTNPIIFSKVQEFDNFLDQLSNFKDSLDPTKKRINILFSKSTNTYRIFLSKKPHFFKRFCDFWYKPKHRRLSFVIEKTVELLEKNKSSIVEKKQIFALQKLKTRLLTINKVQTKAASSLQRFDKLIADSKEKCKENDSAQCQAISDNAAVIVMKEQAKQSDIQTQMDEVTKKYKVLISQEESTSNELLSNKRVRREFHLKIDTVGTFHSDLFNDPTGKDFSIVHLPSKNITGTYACFFSKFLKENPKAKEFTFEGPSKLIQILLDIFYGAKLDEVLNLKDFTHFYILVESAKQDILTEYISHFLLNDKIFTDEISTLEIFCTYCKNCGYKLLKQMCKNPNKFQKHLLNWVLGINFVKLDQRFDQTAQVEEIIKTIKGIAEKKKIKPLKEACELKLQELSC